MQNTWLPKKVEQFGTKGVASITEMVLYTQTQKKAQGFLLNEENLQNV